MPTLIGHAVTGVAFSTLITDKKHWLKVSLLSVFCAVIPDVDVLSFKLGIPYEHWLGHRGFTHSFSFSILLGTLVSFLVAAPTARRSLLYAAIFSLSAMSHCLLDAFTNGGLGVAFFSPFSNQRYFFPWQPIEVSPLNLRKFLSGRGLSVLKSEFVWVMLPSAAMMLLVAWFRLRVRKSRP